MNAQRHNVDEFGVMVVLSAGQVDSSKYRAQGPRYYHGRPNWFGVLTDSRVVNQVYRMTGHTRSL